MVIEHPIPQFFDWIGFAALKWVVAVAILLAIALVAGLVISLLRRGPGKIFSSLTQGIKNGFQDLFCLSWGRVLAVARLMVQESIRKKVVVICVVFLILLMFAGWFIDPSNKNPAALYLNFVLSTTSYFLLLLSLFLSTLSLPADFKNKTIYTIVTKPVRASEIVLGRILGLAFIGTVILLFMAVLSYFFVSMSLRHTHVVIANEDIKPVAETEGDAQLVGRGQMRMANWHTHQIEEYADGTFSVEEVNNHTHSIKKIVNGDDVRYVVGAAKGAVQAKVPIYGKMVFRGADAYQRDEGISVGEEWGYRSYFAGQTGEAAVWTFENLKESQFKDGLPIEMTIGVYRSHKGNLEQTVMGELLVRNPKTGMSAGFTFNSEKYRTKAVFVPRQIDKSKVDKNPLTLKVYQQDENELSDLDLDPSKESYDLFEDFVVDGKLQIWVQCLEEGQYFGAAQPDLYIRSRDANVFVNFIKAYLGIWQEMVILLAYGVLFSTFLSGPVAMFSTFGVMIAAFCKEFFSRIALMQELGGGPFEAWERLITHENLMSDLSNTFNTYLIKFFDLLVSSFLWVIGLAIPSFTQYNIYADSVASGFNIPLNTILVHGITTLAYVLPLFVVGYLILRNREVAK